MAQGSGEIAAALLRGRRALPGGLSDAGQDSVQGIQRTLGRPYPGASLPGTVPHRRTGRLQRQIDAQRPRGLTITIVFRAFYARFLEFGTRKMAARPFIRVFFRTQGARVINARIAAAFVRGERRGVR